MDSIVKDIMSAAAVDSAALDSAEAGVENLELGDSKKVVLGTPDNDDTPNIEMPPLITSSGTAGNINDDDSDTDSDALNGDADGDGVSSTADADEILLKAAALKEEGNAHFSKKELDDAARCYRRGTSTLKKLNKNNTGDSQVQALLVSLQTNLSMVCFKQEKYKMSGDVACKALEIDPLNVKALYRRAVAYRKTGDLDGALADLRQAAKLDPKNVAVRKDYMIYKKELEVSTKNQKRALQKAFDSKSGSSFLYDDKEAEQKRKDAKKLLEKKKEQELYKKRKIEWEDECVKLMAKGEPAITFDDWDEARKEKAEAEETLRKEEEKKRKQHEREARDAARKNSEKDDSDDDSDDDDDKLTERELAMMRGYKKTADGRTTSYFNNELSDHAKQKIGDITPQRNETTNAPTLLPARLKSAQEGESQPSAWNQAGTWEEKDTTTWCTSQLEKKLEETTASMKFDAAIVKLGDLTGDASAATAGGKKRYIFDYHARLEYEIKDPAKKVVASGEVRLPDICSTSHEELEVVFDAWKKAPTKEAEEDALAARGALAEELRATVQQWVVDFNEKY
jgi:tetratricopeptide (TPR) repeat protein